MSINDVNLLNLTIKKSNSQQISTQTQISEDIAENQSNKNAFDDLEINLTNKSSKMDLCGNISDEEIVAYMNSISEDTKISKTTEIFTINNNDNNYDYANSDEGIAVKEVLRQAIAPGYPNANQVKSLIYDYRHPKIKNGDTYQTAKTWNGDEAAELETHTTSTSALYGGSFDNFFTHITNAGIGITKTQGIPRSKLFALTQNDTAEDANMDLYAALNLAFADRAADGGAGGEDLITYKDLQLFFIRMGGNDKEITYYEYMSNIENYSKILDEQYQSLDAQGKFDFAYQKTVEYLKAANLQLQLDALNRLYDGTETVSIYNDGNPGHGQIRFFEYNNANINGSYGYFPMNEANYIDINGQSGNYKASVFGDDNDIPYDGDSFYGLEAGDMGLNLKMAFLTDNKYHWYDLVETLVHELTHATAYYYVDQTALLNYEFQPSAEGLLYLKNLNIITDAEYSRYKDHWSEVGYGSPEYNKIMYLIDTVRGEYAAYNQSSNVLDAFGGDIWHGVKRIVDGTTWIDTTTYAVDYIDYKGNNLAVDGTKEWQAIKTHVYEYYDKNSYAGNYQAIPDEAKSAKYKNIGNLKEVGLG